MRRQSEHFDTYRTALDRLVKAGLVYPAFGTPSNPRYGKLVGLSSFVVKS